MNKVNKQHSKAEYVDFSNNNEKKTVKNDVSVKKQTVMPKADSKVEKRTSLTSYGADVKCYQNVCKQIKDVGSNVAKTCLDKITSSEDHENEVDTKSKGLLGKMFRSIKNAVESSVRNAVVDAVVTKNLKDLPKVLCEKPEQSLIVGSRFAASSDFVETLRNVYSSDTKAVRLLKAKDIPGKIKTVIEEAKKSEETINERNVQEISKNILNAAKQILQIMKDKSPIIQKLNMENTLGTIQKNLPTEKKCPAVAEKLVKELLQMANLHLKQPKSRPDDDLLKKILAKAAEILQNNK